MNLCSKEIRKMSQLNDKRLLKFLEILIQRATDKGDDKVDMAITFNDKSLHEYREYLLSQIIKNSKN